ncbi:MAG TPA: hypothetical protein ENN61_06000, partial [Bacteroidaceae bacterium]|nr:hypothetical protein [Bacteroidaceae bacterium]
MVLLVIFSIPAVGLLFLQNQQVQTVLSKYAAKTISELLHVKISLSSINITFFKRFQVRDLYIEDHHGDTLLYSEVAKIRIKQFKPDKRRIHLNSVKIENACLNFVTDSTGILNLMMMIDPFMNPHLPPEKKITVLISDITVENSRFGLSKMVKNPRDYGINFTDLDFAINRLQASDLSFARDTVNMLIDYFEGREKSGFIIEKISSALQVDKRHLILSETAIKTKGSDCFLPLISFEFDQLSHFKSFAEYVNMHIVSDRSDILGSDLAYFVPVFKDYLNQFVFTGTVSGKIRDLRGKDLFIQYNDNSYLNFDFVMIGLPDIRNTFLDFNFKDLNTSYGELNQILLASNIPALNDPDLLGKFGDIQYKGGFTGYPDNFVTSGYLGTNLGNMILDLLFQPEEDNNLGFHGRLQCKDFLLGQLINQQENIGTLDMDIFAEGIFSDDDLIARLSGKIDTLELYSYSYSNINLDGTFQNKTFDGKFSISDPNIMLDFEGLMDFSSDIPTYNFVADVGRARPYYLKLRDDVPDYFASFLLKTNLSGRSLDELNGQITLVNSLFEKTGSILQMYNFNLLTHNTPDTSYLMLQSDLVDAEIRGRYKITELPRSFSNLIDNYLNIDPDTIHGFDSFNHFTYKIDFKKINPVLDFFVPTFQIGDNSTFEGIYNPPGYQVKGQGHFHSIGIAGNTWNNMKVLLEADSSLLTIEMKSDLLSFGELSFENQYLNFSATEDTAYLNLKWDNYQRPLYKGNLKMTGFFNYFDEGIRQFNTRLSKSEMIVNNDIWILFPSRFRFSPLEYSFDSLLLVSVDKYILVDGTYSKTGDDEMNVSMNDMDLHQIVNLIKAPVDLEGKISGNIILKNLDNNPYILSNLEIDDLFVNKEPFGHANIIAQWDNKSGSMLVNANTVLNNLETLSVTGNYIPSGKQLNFNIRLNNVHLGVFEPYASNIATKLDGFCNARLTLDGTADEPELNGSILFDGGTAVLNYLNTRYIFNDDLRIYRNNIYFDKFTVLDRHNNRATINGSVTNSYFRDLQLYLNIKANNLEALNTSSSDNELFYGHVFGTGEVNISGPPNNLKFNINARTNRNTSFFLPLYNASEVKMFDFVTFIKDEAAEEKEIFQPKIKIRGLELAMELEITPEADVQLIFDPKVGDIIRTAGRGILQISLDEKNDFQIFGDVELQRGDYLFTLHNVINKRFEIEPGSKISFNGSPTNANIDLNANYNLKAALYNLSPEGNDENLKKRIPVECQLTLTGELTNPTIKPGIHLPTADPETKFILENSISTEEELMKQFLALLVINNFYSVSVKIVDHQQGEELFHKLFFGAYT